MNMFTKNLLVMKTQVHNKKIEINPNQINQNFLICNLGDKVYNLEKVLVKEDRVNHQEGKY